MQFRVEKRHILLGFAVVLAPLAGGCGPSALSLLEDTNSRTAYMVNKDAGGGTGSFDDEVVAHDIASATITADGNTMDFKTDSKVINSFTGLSHIGGGFYSGPTAHAQVMPISDVDGNGTTDDTFLVYAVSNPENLQKTEYSFSYHGTRADGAFIQTLQNNDHKATYTGGGAFVGAIGSHRVDMAGDLTMNAKFAGGMAGITGRIDHLSANPGGTPPVGLDALTFEGNLSDGSADYEVSNVKLHNGGSQIDQEGSTRGVGSFFGPRAGGTIGVFSHTSKLKPAVDPAASEVHIIGSFHGSTTDNN